MNKGDQEWKSGLHLPWTENPDPVLSSEGQLMKRGLQILWPDFLDSVGSC